jgi:hypothetical protein
MSVYDTFGLRNPEVTSTKLSSPLRRHFTITSCFSSPILVPVESSMSCRMIEGLEKIKNCSICELIIFLPEIKKGKLLL